MKTLSNVIQYSDKLTARYMVKEDSGKWIHRVIDFSEARASIIMPSAAQPGYFLIMGREIYPNEYGRNPLRFMMEGEDLLHDILFEKLSDAAKKCRSVACYAKQDRTVRGMEGSYRELWQYLRTNRISGIRLMPAPSATDVEYGKTIIRDYVKSQALYVPEDTILRRQLKDMTKKDKIDDAEFYAFHALRYLIAGFSKSKRMPLPWLTATKSNIDRKSAGGWT